MKILSRIGTYFERRARVTRTIKELNSLTDRELADIGLYRSQIYEVALQEWKR